MERLTFLRLGAGVVVAGVVTGTSLPARSQSRSDIERTVYFTARTTAGEYVADLASADLRVVEGGRARQIVRVVRSDSRLKICLGIEEALSPDAAIRQAARRFVEQLQGTADIALYLVGHGNAKLVDYTADPRPLQQAIAALPRRAQGGGNLVESLFELAKSQRSLEGRRTIVILASEIPQRLTVSADGVLEELRDSGIALYAVTLVGPAGTIPPPTPEMAHLETLDEVERDRALNDGTRQTGGLRVGAMRADDFPSALDRIRAELQFQYRLSYVLPAGSKSDGRVSITTMRRGVTIHGPRQLPKLQN